MHDLTSLPFELSETPGGRELVDRVRRRRLESLQAGLAALTEPARGFGHSDYLLRLDTDDLEGLEADLEEVIARYSERRGEHVVSLHLLALPRPS